MASRFHGPFARGGDDPLASLYREMNRLVDDVLGGTFRDAAPGGAPPRPWLDMHEHEDELCVSVEVPGLRAGDVEVRLEGDTLTISGDKKRRPDAEPQNGYVMERRYGRFSRALTLPFRPDPDAVRADCEDGVLTIRLRRAQPPDSRRIQVRGADSAADTDRAGSDSSGRSQPEPGMATGAGAARGGAQPAPRNDEAGYAVSPGSATEGNGAMGVTGTEAGASRSVGP